MNITRYHQARRTLLRWLAGAAGWAGWPASSPLVAQRTEHRRQFAVHATRYEYKPTRIEVDEGDLVRIEFFADDIPHGFTLEAYRIAKRARPGQPAVFEFLADRPGTFAFYCSLTLDEGCRAMRGQLVVRPRPVPGDARDPRASAIR